VEVVIKAKYIVTLIHIARLLTAVNQTGQWTKEHYCQSMGSGCMPCHNSQYFQLQGHNCNILYNPTSHTTAISIKATTENLSADFCMESCLKTVPGQFFKLRRFSTQRNWSWQ